MKPRLFSRYLVRVAAASFVALAGCATPTVDAAPAAPAGKAPDKAAVGLSPDPGIAQRRERVRLLGESKFMNGAGPKARSYDVLAATALRGCGPSDWAAYMAGLPSVRPDDSPDVEPMEMFALPPLVRYLYQFGRCLSAEQKQQLLAGLTRKQKLTGGGTTNHAIMRATSWYLLAQYFPDAQWNDFDGKQYSSSALMSILKARLAARTARVYRFGFDEWLSPTYSLTNLFPILNLVDFATDPAVSKLAADEAALEVGVMRAHSFHGILVPPITRKNFEQRNAPDTPRNYTPSIGQQILWYYFGEPEMSDYDLQSRKEPYFITMLAQSPWVPPDATKDVGLDNASKYSIKMVTPAFGEWGKATPPAIYGDSYITDDFAIGTGNIVFDPAWYNDHNQTFAILLKSSEPKNQIECFQPYWDGNEGEDNWGTDRSSPFQQMYRYDDTSVVMLFDIPQRDPWLYDRSNRFFAQRADRVDSILQVLQCRIPLSFQEIVTEPKWVFVKQGNVFVAIGTLEGSNEYDKVPAALGANYRVMKVREAKSALFFRVERARPDLDFSKFQAQVRKSLPTYDKASSSVDVVDKSGNKIRVAFNLQQQPNSKYWSSIPTVTRAGQSVPIASDATVESPSLSLRSGVLEMKAKTGRLRLEAETK